MKKIVLLRVIPTMAFQNSHVRFYVSLIVSGEGRHATHLLKCVRLLSTSQTDWRQSSDIFSGISFGIHFGISSDILFDIQYLLTFCLTFFLTYLLTFFLPSLMTLFLTCFFLHISWHFV